MSLQTPTAREASAARPARDLEAFLALVSSLSGKLAGATGDAVEREVGAGLRELLSFFDVEQCGILEIQPDMRQARLRHHAYVDGVAPVPTTIDYGAFFPWTHERGVMQGKMFVQTCIDDLPPEAVIDRASSAALGLEAIINVPVGIGGRITHVLALVSSRPMSNWPEAILSRLQMIAETFLAVLARRTAEDESRRLRLELRHADRAAHVGALTASLSHELNQPLMAILANSQAALLLLAQDRIEPGNLRQILESIVRDDKRAATVIGNLRMLLRREEPPRERLDIAAAISEVMTLFKGELEARHVRLETQFEADCVVFAVRTQIQQVMLNLLSNAVQALQERPPTDRRLRVALSRIGRDWVEVTVQDNGAGIPADRLARIFEPFVTTRSDGLGMGLAIARSIVETHGGEIVAQAHEEGGATFRFLLPVEPPTTDAGVMHAAQVSSPDRHPRAYDGQATVCVVDDDPAIREGVARLLGAAGWRAVTFDSAAALLESAELSSAHCLVLDEQMPGMSGSQLHAELVRRTIDTPVVFLTARGDAATGVEAIKHGAIEYLCKPVDDSVLIEAVGKALAGHDERARTARERVLVEERLARLTPRERDVLREVIAGHLNKQIAADLSISEATVKQHRGQVMDKLEVRSVADLVRLCQVVGFTGEP